MGRAFGARGGHVRGGDTNEEESLVTCERLVALAPFDGNVQLPTPNVQPSIQKVD
jgi:hypothetical protein